MVPLVGVVEELRMQAEVIHRTAAQVFEERGDTVAYKVGTMIEVPRAAVTADQIAEVADFFSFGTNDLTQMTFGYSRDDAGKFLKIYKEKVSSKPIRSKFSTKRCRATRTHGRGKRPFHQTVAQSRYLR